MTWRHMSTEIIPKHQQPIHSHRGTIQMKVPWWNRPVPRIIIHRQVPRVTQTAVSLPITKRNTTIIETTDDLSYALQYLICHVQFLLIYRIIIKKRDLFEKQTIIIQVTKNWHRLYAVREGGSYRAHQRKGKQ